MSTRVLLLVLWVLLAGPLSLPGWASVRSETRVGGSSVNEVVTDFVLEETGLSLAVDAYKGIKDYFGDEDTGQELADLAWEEELLATVLVAMDDQEGEIEIKIVPQCFAAGTQINAECGSLPIEEVRVGDRVWAWDETANSIQLRQVRNLFRHTRDALLEIQIGNEQLRVTPEHPFYTSCGERAKLGSDLTI